MTPEAPALIAAGQQKAKPEVRLRASEHPEVAQALRMHANDLGPAVSSQFTMGSGKALAQTYSAAKLFNNVKG